MCVCDRRALDYSIIVGVEEIANGEIGLDDAACLNGVPEHHHCQSLVVPNSGCSVGWFPLRFQLYSVWRGPRGKI